MNILFITLPVFLIIFFGWVCKKYSVLSRDWIHNLNQFAYYMALPALIISNLLGIDFSDKKAWTTVSLSAGIIILFSLIILGILSFIKIRTSLKVAIFLTATAGNTIYMAMPLVETAFGQKNLGKGALIGVIFLVLPLLISIFVIKYWHNKNHKAGKQLLGFLKNPMVISVVIGIALGFIQTDLSIFQPIKKTLSMLGTTASPVALFALGGFLHGKFLKKDLGIVFSVSLLKLLALPLVVFIFFWYAFKANDLGLYMLLASMPTAVTAFVIAEEFNLEADVVGNVILVSTILSFFVIPLILLLI